MAGLRKGCLLILGLLAWLAISCDELEPEEGQLECSSDSECPPEWECNVLGDELCYSDESEFPRGN